MTTCAQEQIQTSPTEDIRLLLDDEMIIEGDIIKFKLKKGFGNSTVSILQGKMTAGQFRKYITEQDVEIYRKR